MTVEAPPHPLRPAGAISSERSAYGYGLSADAFHSLGCMEGVYEPVVTREAEPSRARPVLRSGYLLAAILAAAAYIIHLLPVAPFSMTGETGVRHPISAAIIAIIIGMIARNLLDLPVSIKAGCRHIVKKMIPVAIVLIGAGLNLSNIATVGLRALFITVVCLVLAVGVGYVLGKLFGLGPKTSLLLGAGTGICGNSAIVAVAPLIDAEDDDVVLSIGTVNLFGLLAMLIWPVIGHRFALGHEAFGVWCGTSIHAVPQVVAAGFAFSPDAGAVATLVKLVRVTMLAPLVFVLALMHSRAAARTSQSDGLVVHYTRLIPWFVWGFLALALLNTLGMIPSLQFPVRGLFANGEAPVSLSVVSLFTGAGEWLLTLAMAAIGLDVNIRELTGVGSRAVVAGLASTAFLGAVSLMLIGVLM